MTDFIHEHPKDEQSAVPAPPSAPAEPELDEKTGQKRVYGYIFILFIVAFSLLLWSFLMNQRSNEQVISELRGSTNTLQSTLERNVSLEKQVDELNEQLKAVERVVDELKADNEALERQVAEITLERDAARSELEQLKTQPETDKDVPGIAATPAG